MTAALTIEAVKAAAAAHFGLTVPMLDARRMDRDLVRARFVAVKAAADMTSKSLSQIGRSFGGRDHTTIRHALNVFDRNAVSDRQLFADLDAVKTKVSEASQPELPNEMKRQARLIAELVATLVKEPAPPSVMPANLKAAIDAVSSASRELENARYTALERVARTKLERAAATLCACAQNTPEPNGTKETTHG